MKKLNTFITALMVILSALMVGTSASRGDYFVTIFFGMFLTLSLYILTKELTE